MTESDLITIGGTLILAATALIAPYVSVYASRRFLAPQLILTFELEPPCSVKTLYVYSTPEKIPVYYFRFQVINKGKSQARLCEVVVENFWIYTNNKPQQDRTYSPVNLRWSGDHRPLININTSRKFYCDFGHISSSDGQKYEQKKPFVDIKGYQGKDLRFYVDATRVFSAQASCLAPGKYIFEIGLYSENCEAQKFFYQIYWSGNWKDNEVDMFKEIVITQVKNPESGNP